MLKASGNAGSLVGGGNAPDFNSQIHTGKTMDTIKCKALRDTRGKVVSKDAETGESTVETIDLIEGKSYPLIEKDAVYLSRIGRVSIVVEDDEKPVKNSKKKKEKGAE